ncbi:MAG: YceI family protein [Thermoflexibacter sp.]|jgi:polyisoprenoid-binding protein YceI|nr:YceI family protein [Thermoflexibacter sp.]
MNNKILIINYLILMIALLPFSCQAPAKEENKNNTEASPLSSQVGNEKYVINTKESVITWKGSMLISTDSHTGYVSLTKGELMLENGQLVGGAVEIDMNTITDEVHGSDNGLVEHLKDADFFDVKKFPLSTIAITKFPSEKGEHRVAGNLTIKGITRPVTFPAKMEVKNGIFKADGKLVINRTHWGIHYNSATLGFLDNLADKAISDSVKFHIKIVAKKPLSTAEREAERKKWEATPDGIFYKKWEESPAGKKVYANEAKIRESIRDSTNMEGFVTSLSLPQGARLGFGVMVRINGDDYILAFGIEESNEFEQLRSLKVNDKIMIKSRNVSHAPKYAYPIVAGDYVERDSKIIYKRVPRKGGC